MPWLTPLHQDSEEEHREARRSAAALGKPFLALHPVGTQLQTLNGSLDGLPELPGGAGGQEQTGQCQ